MDRNREARRASIVGSNGFNRRRHRTNNLRDSPDEDGGLELQESVRLRDRVKKDRDRERERDRERDRDRERERERERDLRERSSRSKRRRGERLASNREDIGADETSEESVNDEEDDEDEESPAAAAAAAAGVRSLTPITNHHHHGHLSNHHHNHSSSFSQQQNSSNSPSNIVSSNHHLQPRKSFPPSSSSAKVLRAPPVWKPGDEMISVTVPRKARSASTKRSHDWISSNSNNNSGGGVSGGEPNLGHASSSPARQPVAAAAAPLPPAPVSPSSSNASMRKKLKTSVNNSGPKLKPPKVSSKPSSSNPEELEIEIAEVLYGLMTQSQAPSSKKEDSREINRLNSDVKSRNSSPISNSTSTNNPSLGTNSSPLSVLAPKRKRPRQIPENSSYGVRSSPVSAKTETDQTPKSEISSPNLEKIAAENGCEMGGNLQGKPSERPPTAPESAKSDLELKAVADDLKESRVLVAKEEVSSPKDKESPAVRAEEGNNGDSLSTATASSAVTAPKSISMLAEMENQKEEKFEIDLMAPPRSSPDGESKNDSRDSPVDQKPVVSSIVDAVSRSNLKAASTKDEEGENSKSGKDNSLNEEKKGRGGGEEAESQKAMENKGSRNADLHLDLEKSERNCTGGDGVNSAGYKSQSEYQKQPRPQIPLSEKSGHTSSSLPMPISMAGWPGGLPPMGYMAPLQGVVSVEGGAAAPGGHIQPLFSQPRPKRCATHCHIARNIHYLQQCMKMNPFWPPPASSASLFGSKPCNLNVIPAGDMHGNVAVRSLTNPQDKAQGIASNPSHAGKEKGSQPATTSDSGQRKQQILIQQALPPVAPSNLLGPAFIFPLNQQQQSAVAARPSSVKSPPSGASGNVASAGAMNATSAPPAMSFNYPNMGSNETQYLAILQNNGYPFPIPAPNYRGNPAQAMPLFNGSFYSSQMIHPSQIQHHQPPHVQSSGSASAQKHVQQGQQQRPQSGGGSGGGGGASGGSAGSGMQNFSGQKAQPSQPQNQYAHPSRPRHNEGETGNEESPSTTTDSRASRASMNVYGQNFAMPIHPQNFALMTPPAALASAAAANSNHNDKKGHQQQQSGLKTGPESLPPHGFAMSFGTINGANTGPGIDIASVAQNMVQNHAMFQSSSEAAARQNFQIMAAAQAAQKKNFRMSDDGKSGGVDSATTDDERKNLAGKAQSIAFTRQDMGDGPGPVTSIQANSGIDSSARSLGSRGVSTSRPMTSNPMGANAMSVANAHNIQVQIQQQQMLQLKHQQQQQQQQHMAANRIKMPATSNGSIYTEHLNSSSSIAAKFPNALSGFPQNLVQSNSSSSSPNQSPQWKNATRTPTNQNQSSLSSSTTTTLKNLPSRTQPQMHTQISFGGNQKPSTNSQGQAPPPSNNQNPSSPMMVGSPTTSSISKGASGSPRTTSSASTNNKMSQGSSLSAQPVKNPTSNPSQKSPSILGNPHISSSSSTGPKSQVQQQAQQQLPKNMQQAQQLFFSNPYAQSQPHSASMSSTAPGPSGYYMARRRPDQHQQATGGGPVTSAGGLSLCPPVTMGSTNTNDPATAIAAATANVKGGGGLSSQGMIHAPPQFGGQSGGTLLPAGFSYVHPVPATVQVKPAEQKQPAGNDNLHQWQPEKK